MSSIFLQNNFKNLPVVPYTVIKSKGDFKPLTLDTAVPYCVLSALSPFRETVLILPEQQRKIYSFYWSTSSAQTFSTPFQEHWNVTTNFFGYFLETKIKWLYMSFCFIPLLLILGFCTINNEKQIIFFFTSQTCWGDEIPLLCVYNAEGYWA